MLANLLHLLAAYLLSLPMAIERERRDSAAGLRTFPLVGMASCGYVLVALSAFGDDAGALSRALYGLMTGIGFIGGGAILKHRGDVEGTATAASIWSTGAVGAAIGFGTYEVAVALSLVTAATLYLSPALKKRVGTADDSDETEDGD